MKFFGKVIIFLGLYALHSFIDAAVRVGAFFFGLLLIAIVLFAIGGRILHDAQSEEQLEQDLRARMILAALRKENKSIVVDETLNQKFFLYLRPFNSTNVFRASRSNFSLFSTKVFSITEYDDIERYAILGLRRFGPTVALGLPGEHWGAGRVAIAESEWKTVVVQLAKAAALVVLLPSHRPGTLWEIQMLIEEKLLGKTVFLMPPLDDGVFKAAGVDAKTELALTIAACKGLGLDLPDATFGGSLIRRINGENSTFEPMPHDSERYWRKAFLALFPEIAAPRYSISYTANRISRRQGLSTLMQAAGHGDVEAVTQLLASGADVNACSKIGSTALMYAAKNGRADIVDILMKNGGNPTLRTIKGNTASDFAMKGGYSDIVTKLASGNKNADSSTDNLR